ncbi:hypothetical protein LR48_Vigan07g166500 [Vigna angularis]|uniref:Uncharacterized protein n=1 Tax=Phaseolus angularis TaxID=3914 RepID=A0A0L9UZ56_PHAAN|nr:hypothetical protein LR48_Vigan07g166500 [Vigna angularis]
MQHCTKLEHLKNITLFPYVESDIINHPCHKGDSLVEQSSQELVKYCYGDRGIVGSSLVYLRKCSEEKVIFREVFGGSVSSFVKIQRRCCLISCGIKRAALTILTTSIGRPEHPGRVRTVGIGVGIRDYFGSFSRQTSYAYNEEQEQRLT